MKLLAKKLSDKSGATLVVVITIFAIVVIVGSILITIGSASYKNSISFHNQKQAYYTARSVLDSVVKGITDSNTWQGASGTGGIKAVLESTSPNADGHRIITTNGSNLEDMGEYEVEIKQTSAIGSRVALKVTVKSKFKGKGYMLSANLKEQSSDMEPIRFAFFAKQGSVNVNSSSGSAIIDGDVFGRGSFSIKNTHINVNDIERSKALITNGAFEAIDSQIGGNLIVNASRGGIDISSTSTMMGKIYTDNPTIYSGQPLSNFDVEVVNIDDIGMNDAIQTNVRTVGKSYVTSDTGVFHFANGLVANPTYRWVKLPNGAVLEDDGSDFRAWKNYTEYSMNYGGGQTFTTIEDMEATYEIKLPVKSIDTATSTIELLDGDQYSISAQTYTIMSDDATPSPVGVIDLAAAEYEVYQLDDIILDADGTVHTLATIPSQGGLPATSGGAVTITDKLCKINTSNFMGTYTFDTGALQEGVAGDIRVLVEPIGSTVNFNNVNIRVTGDNNVYFYFPDTVTDIAINNSKIGESSTDDSQLYFISAKLGLNCKMDDSSRLKGVLYFTGDYSEYKLTGTTATTDDRIVGSITADEILIDAGGRYRFTDLHKEPYFNTRLDTSEYFIYSRKQNIGWNVHYGD